MLYANSMLSCMPSCSFLALLILQAIFQKMPTLCDTEINKERYFKIKAYQVPSHCIFLFTTLLRHQAVCVYTYMTSISFNLLSITTTLLI